MLSAKLLASAIVQFVLSWYGSWKANTHVNYMGATCVVKVDYKTLGGFVSKLGKLILLDIFKYQYIMDRYFHLRHLDISCC